MLGILNKIVSIIANILINGKMFLVFLPIIYVSWYSLKFLQFLEGIFHGFYMSSVAEFNVFSCYKCSHILITNKNWFMNFFWTKFKMSGSTTLVAKEAFIVIYLIILLANICVMTSNEYILLWKSMSLLSTCP